MFICMLITMLSVSCTNSNGGESDKMEIMSENHAHTNVPDDSLHEAEMESDISSEYIIYMIQEGDSEVTEYNDIETMLSEHNLEHAPCYEYSAPVEEFSVVEVDNRYIQNTSVKLYYDENAGLGLCIKKVLPNRFQGLIVKDVRKENWDKYDYYANEPDNGTRLHLKENLTGYYEDVLYDSSGRLIYFSASCNNGKTINDNDNQILYEIEYAYDDNNRMRYRCYRQYDTTWLDSDKLIWESYFGENGRIELDSYYLTHGWCYRYYFYNEKSVCPKYGLCLDSSLGLLTVNSFEIYGD